MSDRSLFLSTQCGRRFVFIRKHLQRGAALAHCATSTQNSVKLISSQKQSETLTKIRVESKERAHADRDGDAACEGQQQQRRAMREQVSHRGDELRDHRVPQIVCAVSLSPWSCALSLFLCVCLCVFQGDGRFGWSLVTVYLRQLA